MFHAQEQLARLAKDREGALAGALSDMRSRELLSTELTIRIDGIKMQKDAFEFERENMAIDGSRRVFLDFAYGERLQNQAPPSDPEGVITEPPVKVELSLEIYDFGEGEGQ